VNPVFSIQDLGGALLFAAMFLFGHRIQPFKRWVHDHHVVTSFCAGMSAAYVFVHVMPELTELRETFIHDATFTLPYHGALIYFAALVGFLVFYGLDSLHVRIRDTSSAANAKVRAFRLQLAGFAAYAWVVAYLLVRGVEHATKGEVFYTIALSLHFLTVARALYEEHGPLYERSGRVVLAAMVMAGWLVGMFVAVDAQVVALFMAFISGAVIINATIEELPSEQHGHFVSFVSGGLGYGAALVILG
jgi:hypothetical protein